MGEGSSCGLVDDVGPEEKCCWGVSKTEDSKGIWVNISIGEVWMAPKGMLVDVAVGVGKGAKGILEDVSFGTVLAGSL